MNTIAAITPDELAQRDTAFVPPTLVDVRRHPAFAEDLHVIPGAVKRPPETVTEWADALEPWRPVVVYCVHGHAVSQNAAAALAARGFDARFLDGGIAGWRDSGHVTVPFRPPTRWVTRERPKIDRIACPWLIRRFIDPRAEFLYVPSAQVATVAKTEQAIPYDVPDVQFSHRGALCSFDAFVADFGLDDPALAKLALIVRGADTGKPELTPQSPGLLAISRGLSVIYPDDHAMLEQGMVV